MTRILVYFLFQCAKMYHLLPYLQDAFRNQLTNYMDLIKKILLQSISKTS